MMLATAQDFLTTTLKTQQQPMVCYDFHGQRIWIKKANKHNSIWLYRLVGLGISALNLTTLTPVPSLGGTKAIQTEINRLKTLQAHQINVPTLLAYNEHGLMIKDLGQPHRAARQLDETLLHLTDSTQCLELFTMASDAILHVHHQQMWLSEAFIRNIMIDGMGKIAFLDFETDPHDYISKEHCYARDWIFFMYSIAIRLKKHHLLPQGADDIFHKLQQESPATQTAVRITCQKLGFIKKFPVDKLGKDGQRLLAALELFSLLLSK